MYIHVCNNLTQEQSVVLCVTVLYTHLSTGSVEVVLLLGDHTGPLCPVLFLIQLPNVLPATRVATLFLGSGGSSDK